MTFLDYMLHEVVEPTISEAQKNFLKSPTEVALNAAHGLAFHRGLGNSFYPSLLVSATHYLQAAEIEAYGAAAYSKPNFSLVASGANQAELSKWVGEFFKSVPSTAPAGLPALESPATQYYGGEERIDHAKGNAIVLAFPGSGLASGKAYKPEFEVLAKLLGGEASIKWSSGTSILAKAVATHEGVSASTNLAKYSDGGLIYVTLTGPSKALAAAAKDVTDAIKSLSEGQISKDDIKKATAQAKFQAYSAETSDAPAVDLIGLSALANGKVATYEEALKGVSSVSESAVKEVMSLFPGVNPTTD
jgi:ubiquinol-cytochrome c reductase core subunit 2